jgi:hypothetical protein
MNVIENNGKLAAMAAAVAALCAVPVLTGGGDEAAAQGGGGGLPQGSEPVDLDPAQFTTEIDNPYWPMQPGARWVYREIDEKGNVVRVVVEVKRRTKTISNGIKARVVRDVVTENGEPIEKTDDWYAQDAAGNIWYLGERTAEYEDGEVTTRAGSFEHGVDGAQAGVIMPAEPVDGQTYRQEYYAGEAEDKGEIVSLDEKVQVPTRYYPHSLMTKDLNSLEPRVAEHKFYVRGIGPVLTLDISGGSGREELVRFSR